MSNGQFKTTHGHSNPPSPEYRSWLSMRERCNRKADTHYKNYGGRGITICKRWHSFANFLADMGERPDGMTLDRIDNDGNYERKNCRWATQIEQSRNRRTNIFLELHGRSQILKDWSIELGISSQTIHQRLKRGWTVEDALTKPLR